MMIIESGRRFEFEPAPGLAGKMVSSRGVCGPAERPGFRWLQALPAGWLWKEKQQIKLKNI
jgi:hypothetical protein